MRTFYTIRYKPKQGTGVPSEWDWLKYKDFDSFREAEFQVTLCSSFYHYRIVKINEEVVFETK